MFTPTVKVKKIAEETGNVPITGNVPVPKQHELVEILQGD